MSMTHQSESLADLAPALTVAQAKIKHAVKDRENPHFRSTYADLAAVTDACRQALTDEGLSVVQTFVPVEEVPTPFKRLEYRKGGEIIETTVYLLGRLRTTLLHASGQWMAGELPIMADWADPQKVGSTITYYRRYALAAICGVATEDDDGNAGSGAGTSAVHRAAPGGNGKPEFPATDQEPPSGAALFRWAKQAGEAIDQPNAWVEFVNGVGKSRSFPPRMVDWTKEEVAVAWERVIANIKSQESSS